MNIAKHNLPSDNSELAEVSSDPKPAQEHKAQVENQAAQHTGSGGAAGSPTGKGQGGLAGGYPNQGHKNGLPQRPSTNRGK